MTDKRVNLNSKRSNLAIHCAKKRRFLILERTLSRECRRSVPSNCTPLIPLKPTLVQPTPRK